MTRICELCKGVARTLCESDQASLCWDCDAKVHSANFLVARHSRSLLCHVCQSPTPWSASGSKLGPTVAACWRCVNGVICGEGAEVVTAEEMEIQDAPWPPPASESSSSSDDEAVVTNQLSDGKNDPSSSSSPWHLSARESPSYAAESVKESRSRRMAKKPATETPENGFGPG